MPAVNASANIHIDRPPQEVFDYVMEVSHDAEWRTGVVEAAFTTAAPYGVGTEGYDRVEANGREMMAAWRVFDWKPGAYARWNLTAGPIRGKGGYVCEPEGTGTRFTLEADVKPAGAYRLLGPIFGLIGRRQNRADIARLKEILEP
jgi:hypothetical protein